MSRFRVGDRVRPTSTRSWHKFALAWVGTVTHINETHIRVLWDATPGSNSDPNPSGNTYTDYEDDFQIATTGLDVMLKVAFGE